MRVCRCTCAHGAGTQTGARPKGERIGASCTRLHTPALACTRQPSPPAPSPAATDITAQRQPAQSRGTAAPPQTTRQWRLRCQPHCTGQRRTYAAAVSRPHAIWLPLTVTKLLLQFDDLLPHVGRQTRHHGLGNGRRHRSSVSLPASAIERVTADDNKKQAGRLAFTLLAESRVIATRP